LEFVGARVQAAEQGDVLRNHTAHALMPFRNLLDLFGAEIWCGVVDPGTEGVGVGGPAVRPLERRQVRRVDPLRRLPSDISETAFIPSGPAER
jgi:hypothetical protein